MQQGGGQHLQLQEQLHHTGLGHVPLTYGMVRTQAQPAILDDELLDDELLDDEQEQAVGGNGVTIAVGSHVQDGSENVKIRTKAVLQSNPIIDWVSHVARVELSEAVADNNQELLGA